MLVKYKIGNKTLILETDYTYLKTEDTLDSILGFEFTPVNMVVFKNSNLVLEEYKLEPLTLEDLIRITKKNDNYFLKAEN